MTYTLPNLPTNIDATYPDRSPGDTLHQQHHDTIGAALAAINAAGGVATGNDLAGLGGGGGGGTGAVSSVNSKTGAVVLTASDVGADPAGAAATAQAAIPAPSDGNPRTLGTTGAGSATAYSRYDHVHAMPSASDVGAATTAQGALAASATQPADLGNAATKNIGTTAGTVAAGNDSRIVNAVQSTSVTTIAQVTQAQYNALSPPNAATFYIVVG